jgi:hypothetical protein
MKKIISKKDRDNLKTIRRNVTQFLRKCGKRFDGKGALLDIAPQDHGGARPHFHQTKIDTLDIDPKSKATFIADICKTNRKLIKNGTYDFVVCTEVLEHTLQPFRAVKEIQRIMKNGGYLFMSVPFNLRIHGPLPDCWRFTEHGLRELLKKFEIISLDSVEDKSRWLMPVHYTVIARKK